MGKLMKEIDATLQEWIGQQKIFFVATAPLAAEGLVNCSPKGLDSFRVLDEHTVAYQDLTGSGVETIAPVKETKRIVIMFCAFDGPPKIVRLHGEGEVLEPHHPDFEAVHAYFTPHMGLRSYIRVKLSRVADSCGYAVPKYEFVEDRDVLDKWCDRKGEQGIVDYKKEKNGFSLDGLRGLELGQS
jgi:hypothetical protein